MRRRTVAHTAAVFLIAGLFSGCRGGRADGASASDLAKAWVSGPPSSFEGKEIASDDFSPVKDERASAALEQLKAQAWVALSETEAADFALKSLHVRSGVSAYLVRSLTYFSPPSAIEGSTGQYVVCFTPDQEIVIGFGALGSGFAPICETIVVLLPAPPKAVYAWLSLAR